MNIALQKLTPDDAERWLALQIEAHLDIYEKYRDDEISPTKETLEYTRTRMESTFREYFFIVAEGEVVGGIRSAWYTPEPPDTVPTRYLLGGIWLLPQYRDRGFGQAAIRQLESRYPLARTWELQTMLQEERNIHLYEKLGYRRRDDAEPRVVNERLTLVSYRKEI